MENWKQFRGTLSALFAVKSFAATWQPARKRNTTLRHVDWNNLMVTRTAFPANQFATMLFKQSGLLRDGTQMKSPPSCPALYRENSGTLLKSPRSRFRGYSCSQIIKQHRGWGWPTHVIKSSGKILCERRILRRSCCVQYRL